jgi:hypothetical protein
MRDALMLLMQRVSTITWLEAETSKSTNFSEIVMDAGCSGGSALVLDTKIPSGDQIYNSEYSVFVRSQQEQEVWLAARIPQQHRSGVSVVIGGQALTIVGEPTSPYGDGYAWYRLGTTKLAGSATSLQLTVLAPEGAELGIDTIVLTPLLPFRPQGTRMPLPAIPPEMLKASRGKG